MTKQFPISISLRNTAPKGDIFYCLVMRFKDQERIFPIGTLDKAREIYISAMKDVSVLESFWHGALKGDKVEKVA